jgi:SAM-dependent methyltransferase
MFGPMMLEVRTIADEMMDADDLAPATYARVLTDLAKVNTITMARRPTLDFLDRVLRRRGSGPLKILDVGFGDGDMLRAIHRWGKRRKVALTLVGIDLNPKSAAIAEAATPDDMTIDYRTGDYAALAGEGFDLIISSIVAHHMNDQELQTFLRFMDSNANFGWLINDLHRHGFAYLGYPLLAALMRWHPIVRHDGRLSIARSYRPSEWPPILKAAGIHATRIFRQFPFRLCVETIR